jgi:hypothetical protein
VIRDAMANLQMNANKDVATILSEDGRVLPSDIGSIIWRCGLHTESC